MNHSLAQIGVDTGAEAYGARAEVEVHAGELIVDGHERGEALRPDDGNDHFVEDHGLRYAGRHLIIDLWDAEHIDDIGVIEMAMRQCVRAAGATLLHIHLHAFSTNGGVSGVAVLAESHISIHTWPEKGYAALDVFMCGGTRPEKVVPILRHAFKPKRLVIAEHKRGVL